MGKGRLEAFSDGVIAIVITIMVLELKVPQGATVAALSPVLPALLSYVLSFVYVGIYWNNHHHLLQACTHVSAAVLWANLHLLFWLSLLPFATGWMGQNQFAGLPTAIYGVVLLMAACAFWLLQRAIIVSDGPKSPLVNALGTNLKGTVSLLLYGTAIVCATTIPWLSQAIHVFVATLWLLPDRRIERVLRADKERRP